MTFPERVVGWLSASGAVAPLVIFAAVFAESGFMLFVPGETAVIAGGALAGSGQLPWPPIAAAAVAGAFLGDSTGYLLGRGPGRRRFSATGRFLLLRQRHVHRVEDLLRRWGVPAVLGARFLPVARVAGPFVFGLVGLPPRRFFPLVALSALAWGTLYTAVGYALWDVLSEWHHWSVRVTVVLAVALVLGAWFAWWRKRRAV